ncbi:uncharacterized protein JN550_007325 [Neoarthrinium moseri]|uniref:uncharacterized protein n=1 Tax=Neoarthrinium moseri TaxID=1658444 RepID=UPI001FDAF555|nr:uncharacterized protein JN550_007325 [Neoarthrinium moseri]KAI1866778.1 hypothetical protein JN550_007325 [Neoarthrinium moseri]
MSTAASNIPPSITIYRGWKDYGKHVWSPFVVKLEARLRFAGIKYTVDAGSPKTAPRGKIPYIEYSEHSTASRGDVTQLSDSTMIIKKLSDWNVIPDFNAELTPAVKAQDMALQALLEDKLYFYHTWERWTQNYYTMRDHVFHALPYPVRLLVGMMVYRSTVATLHGQGTGRFTPEEITAFRQEIWVAVNDLLIASRSKSERAKPNEPFWVLGGDSPTEADATLFGFIVSVLLCRAAPDSQKVVRGFPTVLAYADRIHDKYFPDYEKWKV